MATSNNFTKLFGLGAGRCCKNVCLAFSLVHISFCKNIVYLAYAEFEFFNQIYFLLSILRSPGIG